MYLFRPFSWLMASTLMLFACGDPSPIGADLLSQDQEDVQFTDTLTVLAQSDLSIDSFRVYTPNSQLSGFAFGSWEDPFFGTNTSEFYLQITPGSLSLPVLNDFNVDSVLLVFEIDSSRSYGEFQAPVDYELYEISEAFDNTADYYSNQTFPTDATTITDGTISIEPDVSQTLISGDLDTLSGKMIKIELPKLYGKKLLDTTLLENFDEEYFGIHVKNVTPTPSTSMAVFRAETDITSLNVYYTNITDEDTTNYVYRFLVSPIDVRTVKLDNDITGSELEQALLTEDDEYLYLQGLHGPDVKLTFPHIEELGNILVNSAFLNITVADVAGDDLINYPPANQLVLSVLDEDLGLLLGVDDIAAGLEVFGGTFVADTSVPGIAGTYRLNLSNYFQNIVDGIRPKELFLQVFPKSYDPARSILFGTGSLNKPQLELTYTRINP